MGYRRETIRNSGLPGIIERALNVNFENLWQKVFGDINFTDLSASAQNKINSVPRYVLEAIGNLGTDNTGIQLNDSAFSAEAWNLITTNQDIRPIISNINRQPPDGYDFVIRHSIGTHYDADTQCYVITLNITSGRYASGVLETIDQGYVSFDLFFLIKDN